MKHVWQIILGCISITCLWLLCQDLNHYEKLEHAHIEVGQWQTFSKVEKKLSSYPSTKNELSLAHLKPESQAIIQPAREPASAHPTLQGRRLIGVEGSVDTHVLEEQIDSGELKLVNSVNPDWERSLGEELMRFQASQTKVFVRKEFSLIRRLSGQQLQLLEQVVVHYQNPEGRHTSFKAYVDPATGKIQSTWNRSIHEDVDKEKLGLSPSGQL